MDPHLKIGVDRSVHRSVDHFAVLRHQPIKIQKRQYQYALASESNSCVTIEKGTDNSAQAQSDLHELSAEVVESEKSSILLDTSDELEFRKKPFEPVFGTRL